MVSKIDKAVIQKVRERRIAKGISQSQLSFELGYKSAGFIEMIESGKYGKKYNINQVNEIAKVLECNLHDLIPKQPL